MTDWISIDEQVPEKDKPYLVKLETVGFHYGPDPIRNWQLPINTDNYKDRFFKVTHWKPLE